MALLTTPRTTAYTWGAPEKEKKKSLEEMDELRVVTNVENQCIKKDCFPQFFLGVKYVDLTVKISCMFLSVSSQHNRLFT